VLAEPVEALVRVRVERDLATEQVASAKPVPPLGRGGEMRKLLAEELGPVRSEEAHQGRGRDQPVLPGDPHLRDQAAVAHPRPVLEDLDVRIRRAGLVKGAAGGLCHGAPERRANPGPALPPRVYLEELSALLHGEAGLAADDPRQVPFPWGSYSLPA